MNTSTFNSKNVEKLNEMLNTQVFNWMLAKEKAMTEKGISELYTSCPSTGIIGIAAEVEDQPQWCYLHLLQEQPRALYDWICYQGMFC